MEKVVEDTESKMPGYCTPKRVQQLKEVFEEMDADDELSLDMNEMIPFYQISFKILFDMEPKTEQMEALFHLMDTVNKGRKNGRGEGRMGCVCVCFFFFFFLFEFDLPFFFFCKLQTCTNFEIVILL